MKRMLKGFLILLACLIAAFLLGPRPQYPTFDASISPLGLELSQLEKWVEQRERNTPSLKPDNQARIIWADSLRQTEYAVVYLHGFSASQMEGDPVHRAFAKRYGCNLFLARLPQHGQEVEETFKDITPKDLVEGAKEAIAIGKLLGKKVIVMATSTGGTLGIYLAAHNPDIHSLIMYSPNIDIFDKNSRFLTMPWGKQFARLVFGGNYREWEATPEQKKYWNTRYRIEGLLCMRSLLNETMTDDIFKKISIPYYIGYYYRDEKHFDNTISIEKIKEFHQKTNTPREQTRIVPNPNSSHVMTSPLMADDVEGVQLSTFQFAENVLGLKPKQ